jgi:hypothetical protein
LPNPPEKELVTAYPYYPGMHSTQAANSLKTLFPLRPLRLCVKKSFLSSMGFIPVEVFEELWSPSNPCLQMFKVIGEK